MGTREDLGSKDAWLMSGPEGDVLRKGLAAARARTGDEIARRRIWTGLSAQMNQPMERPASRRLRWPSLVVAGMAFGMVASLALLVWPETDQADSLSVAVENVTVPEVEPESFLQGPAVVRTGPRETMKVRLRGGARLALATHTQLAVDSKDLPELKTGKITLEVPKQPPGRQFKVAAGPFEVKVVGTRFSVSVERDQVGVEVFEGVVEVAEGDRAVRLEAGQTWTGWLSAPSTPSEVGRSKPAGSRGRGKLAYVAPAPAAPAEAPAAGGLAVNAPVPLTLSQQARAALAQGDPDRAITLLERVAEQDGPAGENATYEIGRIWRDHKLDPRRALQIWERYRKERPSGLLRAEVDLSTLETYAKLGDTRRARDEAERFLKRYPRSERRDDVARLLETTSGD